MTLRRAVIVIGGGLIALALLVWAGFELLYRSPATAVSSTPTSTSPSSAAPAPVAGTPHITVTLFYASPEGEGLVAVRRDVALADGVEAQGAQILAAQFSPTPPFLSVVPKGTTLKAFYVTERGDAFVDMSRDVTAAHPGGSLAELLTVHAIVNAVTTNLPKVQRVQLLVEGAEVDTLAGHVDVSRPLTRDISLVRAR